MWVHGGSLLQTRVEYQTTFSDFWLQQKKMKEEQYINQLLVMKEKTWNNTNDTYQLSMKEFWIMIKE